MPNVRLITLRVWSHLLKIQMKEKLCKKFFHVLLWIFPVIRLLGLAVFEEWCGVALGLQRLRVRCPFARLKTRLTSSFPLPWPLCWLEHVRAEVTLRSQCPQHPRMSPELVTCLFWAHTLSQFHPLQPFHCFSKYASQLASGIAPSYFCVCASAFCFCTGIVTPSLTCPWQAQTGGKSPNMKILKNVMQNNFPAIYFFCCLPQLWEKSTKVNSRVGGLCKPAGSSCYHWPVSRGYRVP